MEESPQLLAQEIRLKVIQLLKEREMLEKRLTELEEQNNRLQNELENQKNARQAAEERNKIVKLAESLVMSGDDIQFIRKRLNGYIRDIDECIRLLSDR